MTAPHLGAPDETLDLLASLRATPASRRRQRLQRLPKKVLVELAGLLMAEAERRPMGEDAAPHP